MALVDAFAAGNATIQQLLLQRQLEKLGISPQQLAQQKLAGEQEDRKLRRDQLTFNQQRQTAQDREGSQQHAATEANTLGDQLPPGLILSPTDPAATMMQSPASAFDVALESAETVETFTFRVHDADDDGGGGGGGGVGAVVLCGFMAGPASGLS